jgi:hypothetical protein
MDTAQTNDTGPATNGAPRFTLGAAVLEGTYLAEILALQLSEAWLHAVEEGTKGEHERLSVETVEQRFHGARRELSERLAHRFTELDGRNDVALVATTGTRGRIISAWSSRF